MVKLDFLSVLDEKAQFLNDFSDDIWADPETAFTEFHAAGRYCSALRSEGFEVTENLAGIPTAFSGRFGSGHPVIGVLAEFDALSGLSQEGGVTEKRTAGGACGHGCGHNLLGTASLGAAIAIKRFLETQKCPGTVILFGCPGEEGGSGKAFMAREKVWEKLDAAFCWHPADVNQVKTGTNNSSIQVLYKFKGTAAHAAECPELGRSALDAVELMNVGVQFLREHMTDDCRVHYAILNAGGVSPNVVQSEADVLYMTRANKVKDCVALQKRVDKIAQGAALMTETSFERVFIDGTAELLPNFTLEKLMYDNFEKIGVVQHNDEERAFAAELRKTFPPQSAAPGMGAHFDADIAETVMEKTHDLTEPLNDFLMPYYSGTGFTAGSTDVGDVSWLTPAAQIETATWPSGMPLHTWQTVACGKSSIAYKGMLCAGKVMAASAIDLIEDPELLKAAREEFKRRAKGGYTCPIEPETVPTAL